jgi:hypothetical protein
VTVHEVKRAEKAELNDEFAQEIPPGFDTLEALKAHARVELGKSLERSIEQTVNNRLVELLIDANPFEVPRKMIDAQLDGPARPGQARHHQSHRRRHRAGHLRAPDRAPDPLEPDCQGHSQAAEIRIGDGDGRGDRAHRPGAGPDRWRPCACS